jgi:hypothetical protein
VSEFRDEVELLARAVSEAVDKLGFEGVASYLTAEAYDEKEPEGVIHRVARFFRHVAYEEIQTELVSGSDFSRQAAVHDRLAIPITLGAWSRFGYYGIRFGFETAMPSQPEVAPSTLVLLRRGRPDIEFVNPGKRKRALVEVKTRPAGRSRWAIGLGSFEQLASWDLLAGPVIVTFCDFDGLILHQLAFRKIPVPTKEQIREDGGGGPFFLVHPPWLIK